MNTALNKKFFSYVIPSILAFALSGVYTIVDGFFIGQSLGDTGLTAITLSYPISALIGAVGTGLGLSGAIRFTILNAQGETQKRQECFSGTTLLMLLTAGLLTAILFAFAQPILHLLGARGNMLTLCVMYAQVIALGAVFQLLATGFVPFIRNMGGATVAMIAMAFGFATNIALDYVFVWALNWGMAGAAWATIIGQAVTMFVAVILFLVKNSGFCLPELRELCRLWKNVLIVAISPFGLTFSSIITMLLINRFLLLYGDEQAVAVYGCIGYITAILYLLLQGVGDGSQPLISQYYGKDGLPDRRCDHGSLHDQRLSRESKGRHAVWRFDRGKRRGHPVSPTFSRNAAVSGICPYYNILLLRNGKEWTFLPSRIC